MRSELWSFCLKIWPLEKKILPLAVAIIWWLTRWMEHHFFFFLNFQDFGVFYREIHFAVNGCRNMLIENHMNMITINHITHNTKMFHYNMDFKKNNKTDFGTMRIKKPNDCLNFYFQPGFQQIEDMSKT